MIVNNYWGILKSQVLLYTNYWYTVPILIDLGPYQCSGRQDLRVWPLPMSCNAGAEEEI